MTASPELEAQRALCARPCQLNGRPAVIGGAGLPFARVYDRETGLSAEWSWAAAERVMASGGRFKS